MNPHRPGEGPANITDRMDHGAGLPLSGGGAAKPAGPVVADAGASAGVLVPTQVPVSTAPIGELSASALASASSSAAAPASATISGPAHGAYPDRMRHPATQHCSWP